MKVSSYQHGIFPRSEALVAATRDLERGRTSAGAVADQVKIDTEALIDLQVQAGLDYISEGLLGWQDIFRPLVVAAEGMDPGPLVRWFDNNAFFRAPVVSGPVKASGVPPGMAGDLPAERGKIATLPSPFMFSRAAQGDLDPDRFMEEVATEVIAPAAADLAELGYDIVHLQDPWLGFYGIQDGSWDAFRNAISVVKEATDAELHLHVFFGDIAPLLDQLRSFPVDVLGVDFLETDIEVLGSDLPFGLLAGCIDGRSSVVESTSSVVDFVRRLIEQVEPSSLFLASNSPLELLPETVARIKVETLGDAAAVIEGGSR